MTAEQVQEVADERSGTMEERQASGGRSADEGGQRARQCPSGGRSASSRHEALRISQASEPRGRRASYRHPHRLHHRHRHPRRLHHRHRHHHRPHQQHHHRRQTEPQAAAVRLARREGREPTGSRRRHLHKNFETRSRVAARTESGRYSGLGVNGCPLEGTWQQMSPPRLRAGRVKLAAGPRALRFQTGPTRAPRSPEGLPGVSGRAGEPARPQPTSPRTSHPGHPGHSPLLGVNGAVFCCFTL